MVARRAGEPLLVLIPVAASLSSWPLVDLVVVLLVVALCCRGRSNSSRETATLLSASLVVVIPMDAGEGKQLPVHVPKERGEKPPLLL